MQTAKKMRETKHLVMGPGNAFSPCQCMLTKCSTQKRKQLSPLVPNTLADPLLVWTDAKLAILQSACLILLFLITRLFVVSNKNLVWYQFWSWTETTKLL